MKTQFDKWCFFLKNLETLDSIPEILNEPIFMKAFDVATVNKMDTNDYILYQISKSKKYDMELLQDEAEERGMEKKEISHVLTIHAKGFTPLQISDLLTMPIARVLEIIEKYGELK